MGGRIRRRMVAVTTATVLLTSLAVGTAPASAQQAKGAPPEVFTALDKVGAVIDKGIAQEKAIKADPNTPHDPMLYHDLKQAILDAESLFPEVFGIPFKTLDEPLNVLDGSLIDAILPTVLIKDAKNALSELEMQLRKNGKGVPQAASLKVQEIDTALKELDALLMGTPTKQEVTTKAHEVTNLKHSLMVNWFPNVFGVPFFMVHDDLFKIREAFILSNPGFADKALTSFQQAKVLLVALETQLHSKACVPAKKDSVAARACPEEATGHPYQASVLTGPPGSRGRINKLSPDGLGVGQRLLADGTSQLLWWNPFMPGTGFAGPLLGRQGALVGINADNERVGSLNGSPGSPSLQVPVFVSRTGEASTLPVFGQGNAIAVGSQVAVTTTATPSQPSHVLVWNGRTGAIRNLGPGIARGIDANGVVVGGTVDGRASFWEENGSLKALAFKGALLHVNLSGWTIGYMESSGPTPGPIPVIGNINRPDSFASLTIPSEYRFGVADDISDSNEVVGIGLTDPAGAGFTGGLMWAPLDFFHPRATLRQPRRTLTLPDFSQSTPVELSKTIFGAPFNLAGAVGVNPIGDVGGSANAPAGPGENAVVLWLGRSSSKFVLLDELIKGQPGIPSRVRQGIEHELRSLIRRGPVTAGPAPSSARAARGARPAFCRGLDRLGSLFGRFDFTGPSFTAAQLAQFRADGVQSVNNIKRQVRCG
jgi:hypothetical protein